jgi:hypothetical protein
VPAATQARPGVPQPRESGWPAVSDVRAARLREAWFTRSVETCWSAASDWWDPACDAVVEALADGRDPRPVVRRLGRARSHLGVPVEETLDDVIALWDVQSRREPPARVLRAAAAGWAEAGLEPAGAASCFDAMTGLSTRAHLEARLGELYRSGDLGGTVPGYQLVVLDVGLMPVAEGVGDDGPWRHVEAVYRCAEAVRRVFGTGETLSRLAPARISALARTGPGLTGRLGALDGLLAAAADPDVSPSVWVESLPRTYGLVPQLLADLAR